jgi:hypothetical protein
MPDEYSTKASGLLSVRLLRRYGYRLRQGVVG